MKKTNYKNISSGFTLIELIIVIAIIGILATFSVVNFLNVKQRSRDTQRKSDLRQIQSAFELYRADVASYPASLPACGAALTSGAATYMQKIPCDPINSGQFTYRYIRVGSTYTLVGCLENVNDGQKDASNNSTYCSGGSTNWSYTLTNP